MWPLLTGERAHFELAAGRTDDAKRLLATMESFANEGGLISEQVWDSPDIPERELQFGRPSGWAMPLVWAHAEYLKLRRSLDDGRIFDLPPQTVQRYLTDKTVSPRMVWRFNHKIRTMPAGKLLRIETLATAVIHWSADDWKTIQDGSVTRRRAGNSYRRFSDQSSSRRTAHQIHFLLAGRPIVGKAPTSPFASALCDQKRPRLPTKVKRMQTKAKTEIKGFVYFAVGVAALGGLLFGYDTGVISGAILFIQQQFSLSASMEEVVVSSVLVGAVAGAVIGGALTGRFGRRKMIILAGIIFSVSAIGTALAPAVAWLIAARIMSGIAIGIASFISPMAPLEAAAENAAAAMETESKWNSSKLQHIPAGRILRWKICWRRRL